MHRQHRHGLVARAARHQHGVRDLVVIGELNLEIARALHDDDRGVPQVLAARGVDARAEDAIVAAVGAREAAVREEALDEARVFSRSLGSIMTS